MRIGYGQGNSESLVVQRGDFVSILLHPEADDVNDHFIANAFQRDFFRQTKTLSFIDLGEAGGQLGQNFGEIEGILNLWQNSKGFFRFELSKTLPDESFDFQSLKGVYDLVRLEKAAL